MRFLRRNRTPVPKTDWKIRLRRWRNQIRTFFGRGDASALLIGIALLVIPVLALAETLDFSQEFAAQSGTWAVSLTHILPAAALSVFFGFLLARSHYSELTALLLSAIYAVGTVLLVQLIVAPGDLGSRVVAVLTRFADSIRGGLIEGVGFDPYLLMMFLSILVWFLGHNTAWHIFRLDRVWRAILPPGIVLVLNSVYNTRPEAAYDGYLIAYVFLALLLLIRSHIEAREYDWYLSRIAFRANVRRWFFRFGSLAAVLALLLAWVLPTGSAEENARRFQQFLNEDALTRALDFMNRLFGSLEGQGPVTANYFGGDQLQLGGPIRLGEQAVLAIDAPPGPRYYWKSSVYDFYQNGLWTAPRSSEQIVGDGGIAMTFPPFDTATRRTVTQRVVITNGASRLVYAAPQLSSIQLGMRIELDFIATGTGQSDPAIFWSTKPLERGAQYLVSSSISVADANYLRAANSEYPAWVRARYLQLPPEITQRTRDLAVQIVNETGAATVYDQSKAIETWLRRNITYNEGLRSAPPPGREAVDWMLFDIKEAYCTYYASAMIVMLRSLGIPARMGAGFSQGLYDSANNYYVVRERDAHTWVEVYFPGAGWVEFEPTSAQATLDRPDSNFQAPTPTLPPSATPTFTPTPSPTQDADLAQPPDQPSQQPPLFATFTPTPSPTPTFTPTPNVPPPSFLEFPPPVADFLGGLLRLMLIVTALSFVGVGVLWYIEYRGTDRYSPIGRAYARLGRYAGWLGVSFREGQTPLERGRRLAREVPGEGQSVMNVTDAYISERFSPPRANDDPVSVAEEKQAEEAISRARHGVWRRLLGRRPKNGGTP